MIDSKAVRSPAGQKLINDLMLGDDDVDVADANEVVADAASKQHSPGRSSGLLRPANGHQRRSSLPATRSSFGVAKTPRVSDADTDPSTGQPLNRPATAPASSQMLLVPPQLPAARSPRDSREPRTSNVSPILERHLVSRHTSAYLGVVTAVLHQVSSPAATGAPRGTQRRPGTVPRDVYHHSAIPPPSRRRVGGQPIPDIGAGGGATDGMYSGIAGPGTESVRSRALSGARLTAGDPQPSLYSSLNSRGLPASGGDYDVIPEALDSVGGPPFAPYGSGGLAGRGGSGEYYMPYLDRSYGNHAPLACAVDAVARRAEAHKALTRQRLLQKHLEQQVAVAGRRGALRDTQQQQHGVAQMILARTSNNEPYELRLEGSVSARSLGLAWDTSPGVVAAAAAAAATTAAAIAARTEGLPAAVSPLLRDPSVCPSLRDLGFSPASKASSSQGGGAAGGAGGSPAAAQRRRVGGVEAPAVEGVLAAGAGRTTPAGAPRSPRKVRMAHAPLSAVQASALAAEAEELARSQLPPAVRRGYSGQLSAQTVQDWETIAEPNRRMMQEIENVTTLVRRTPSRNSPRRAAAGAGMGSGASSMKRRGGQELAGYGGGGGAAATTAALGDSDSDAGGVSGSGSAPFGRNTSSRARRRYIRYSIDVFPELGLPPRDTSERRGARGPLGSDGATAAAVAAAAAAGAPGAPGTAPSSGWSPWSRGESGGLGSDVGITLEPSVDQMYEHGQGEPYGSCEYGASFGGAAKGPRYVLAAAARVPVPVHVHPLPTPPAAIAAVVASGGAVAAAAAALPQWMDPLAAAAAVTSADSDQALPALPLSPSSGSASALPAVGSGSHSSLYGGRTPSRGASATLGSLSARGVGLQGHPSGQPLGLPPSSPLLTDDLSGSWSAGGSSPALTTRSGSTTRRHAHASHYHVGGRGPQVYTTSSAGVASAEDSVHGEGSRSSGGAAACGLRSGESPQASQHDVGADSPRRSSVAAAAAGRVSPASEMSLMPLAHGDASAATSRYESGAVASYESTESHGLAAAESRKPPGSAPGMDVDFRLDLGPIASRGSSASSRDQVGGRLDPGFSAADGRLYASRLAGPADDEEEDEEEGEQEDEEEDGHDDDDEEEEEEEEADEEATGILRGGEERETSRAGVGRDDGLAVVDDEGWSFPEGGLASSGPSGSGMATPAVAPSPIVGFSSGEWDAGPTPRLLSRQAAGRTSPLLPPPPRAARPSSALSDVASASLGIPTPRGTVSGRTSTDPAVTRPPSVLNDDVPAAVAAAAASGGDPSARDSVSRFGVAAAAAAAAQRLDDAAPSADDVARRNASPQRAGSMSAPQGPVLTHGTGYRVVTSVAASLVSEDPRELARLAAQRDVEAQLERSAEHTAKLQAASRATKALARAGPQHGGLPPGALPPLAAPPGAGGSGAQTGYSIVQPRGSSRGLAGAFDETHGSLSVLDAPVPAPAEMEAMASAARALLTAPQASRLGQRHGPTALDRDRRPPLSPGSYQHIQATIEQGRTAQMQDVWAS